MDTTAKLANVEMKMRRWHSRLTRASNMLAKLERQRRRLTGKPSLPKAKPAAKAEALADLAQAVDDRLSELASPTGTDIPDFLDRSNPLIAEKMTAARKAAEEAERHKMPLTGRAAIDYVKVEPRKRKKSVTAS